MWPLQSAGVQGFHYVVGARVNPGDARMGPHPLDRIFGHIAIAAMELEALVGDPPERFARPIFGHCGGRGVEFAREQADHHLVDETRATTACVLHSASLNWVF